MKEIVERINELMSDFGLDKKAMSEKLNISAATLSHISSGRNNPSLELILSILKAFPNISPDWLLLGLGEKLRAGDSKIQTNSDELSNKIKLFKMLMTEHYRTEMNLLDDIKQVHT
ncbi:MAG: helix-turn-helix transcriptional regulator [Bacteroidetes bacterium]|nr:helix-turn-helix transcriptional regulator [Bacteroidota bacterium]